MALPGVTVTTNDGGLRVRRPVSGTRVMLLGTTTNTGLSVNQPVVVTNVGLAMSALKNADGSESELSLALADAINGGAQLVEVMKIETANGLDYTGYSTESRFLALSGAYDQLVATDTDVIVPVGAYAEDPIGNVFAWADTGGYAQGVWNGGAYASKSFLNQLAQFCYDQTVEHNTTVGVIGVKSPLLAPTESSARQHFTGVVGELPQPEATGHTINFYGDTGSFFGTPSRTALEDWISYLTSSSTGSTNSVWKNFLSGSNTAYANSYLQSSSGFQAVNSAGVGAVDELGNKVDLGAYVSVIAAPVRSLGADVRKLATEWNASGSNISFNSDGAAAYAGMISSLAPHRGTTNKPLPGIVSARRLSRSQATNLTNSRLVTMLERQRGFVVAKGQTGAYHVDDFTKSDFTQLTTVRIVHAAIDQIRLAAEPYLGEPVNSATQNAMREAIEGGLRAMQLSGALNRFDFALISTPNQLVLGNMSIDVTLVPAFELLSVSVSVKLARE